tara:strand:- start:6991 stop:7839 length:849 start_codon:yes stop_codon:yes gene_type:complete
MKILITGAKGFIGNKLSTVLAKNHTVIKLYNEKNQSIDNEQSINLDLMNKDNVIEYFKKFNEQNNIDIIIHLASKLVSSKDTENIEIFYKNINIAENIVHISKILNPRQLINFSSISVYPNLSGIYKENSKINPLPNNDCIYGLSKYSSEILISHLLRKSKINICHFRVANVIGKSMRDDRIIPVMKKELMKSNSINLFGDGRRVSNFIDIDDLINIVHKSISKNISGIYNVGDRNISYYDLAKEIIDKHGNNDSLINTISNGNREAFNLDCSKINNLLELK